MPIVKAFSKVCNVCNHEQPVRTTKCSNCGTKLTKSGKIHGRPAGTTAAAGYKVSPGRRKNTTVAAGYS